ncbi:unnamed protein product [Ambrosiozyma monospora]|uniref:Unnamed protein product n=1 Tax=Ambrosiozyma monospora TaxID=43982 RepID=A0ACB5T1B7_AMBMO|nr:unnamed protein product [Ambrosiozyma monospora]
MKSLSIQDSIEERVDNRLRSSEPNNMPPIIGNGQDVESDMDSNDDGDDDSYEFDIYRNPSNNNYDHFDDSMLEEVNQVPDDLDFDEQAWDEQQHIDKSYGPVVAGKRKHHEKSKLRLQRMKSFTEHKNIGLVTSPSSANSSLSSNNTIKLDEKTITLFSPINKSNIQDSQSSISSSDATRYRSQNSTFGDDEFSFNNSKPVKGVIIDYFPSIPKENKATNSKILGFKISEENELAGYEDEDAFSELEQHIFQTQKNCGTPQILNNSDLSYITPHTSRNTNVVDRRRDSGLTTISEVSFNSLHSG